MLPFNFDPIYISKDADRGPLWVKAFFEETDSIRELIFTIHGASPTYCYRNGDEYCVFAVESGFTVKYIGCRYDLGPAFELAVNSIGLYLWGRNDPSST